VTEHRYEVLFTATARRDLASLPLVVQRRVARAIDGLAVDPRPPGSRLLVGRPGERIWRLRVGDHRVLYEIRDAQLLVLVIRIAWATRRSCRAGTAGLG
jgi:mRNA interferase RelE/StbE